CHLAVAGPVRVDKAIVLRIIETYPHGLFAGKRLWHLATDVHADGGITSRAGVVEIPAQPAVLFTFAGVAGRLPNLGRTKVRAVRIRITDSLDNRKLAGVVETLETREIRMKA